MDLIQIGSSGCNAYRILVCFQLGRLLFPSPCCYNTHQSDLSLCHFLKRIGQDYRITRRTTERPQGEFNWQEQESVAIFSEKWLPYVHCDVAFNNTFLYRKPRGHL